MMQANGQFAYVIYDNSFARNADLHVQEIKSIKIMALLKEDGSLDIEKINKLPLDEYKKEIYSLSREQYKEFMDNSCRGIIKENQKQVQPIRAKHSLQEELEWG